MTLEELLNTTVDVHGTPVRPGFKIAVQENVPERGLHVIVHAQVEGSEALDYYVNGDELTPLELRDSGEPMDDDTDY